MPLLRRNSSHKDPEGRNTDQHQDAPHSLLRRLSRRGSRERVHEPGLPADDQGPGHDNVEPSVKPSQQAEIPVSTAVSERLEHDASPANGLSKEDVRALFFGAPHFMLEKGRHGKSFPQAFFPWNTDLEVSDLQDRRYLSHQSFALVTLHAHLPIPDEMSWRPTTLPQSQEPAWKRPMMDLGIFETPNMLSVQGREPGTVGLRFFLEVPISERLRTIEKAKEEEKGYSSLAHVSANEAFKKEADRPRTGKHAQRLDRIELIKGGPRLWEQLGLRNINANTIIQRMAFLCEVHDEVVERGLTETILHRQSCAVLYDELFNKLLFPPITFKDDDEDKHHRVGLKVQIEALVKILTTPGAWIDFSLVEPRIRLGQGLWQMPPYEGQPSDVKALEIGAERKWLLLQILLSMELMVRLDAALRLGSSDKFRDFQLTGQEIHHFNKLRNLKVDWDLVVARKFLDLVIVKQGPDLDFQHLVHEAERPQSHLSSMFKKKMETHEGNDDLSIWSCEIIPRRNDVQFQGLLRFARMIGWPRVDELEADLSERYQDPSVSHKLLFAQPILSSRDDAVSDVTSANTTRSLFSGDNWVESACVTLEPAHKKISMGGFLGRSWLTGLIMPGDAGCLSVMACLLEQDQHAAKLGRTAYLHGGFVLDGRSFWSKFCILGRVLAPAKQSTECMGWVNTSEVPPLDHNKAAFQDTWLDVTAKTPLQTRNGLRIYDGQKVADDSNVLGLGRGKVLSSEYSMVTDSVLDGIRLLTIELGDLTLRRKSPGGPREGTLSAAMTFTSSVKDEPAQGREMHMTYNVGFISSHPCRPPHGHAILASEKHEHPHHKAHEHLPAHPLHNTYKFEVKSIADLSDVSPPDAGRDQAVWIVDARGPPAHDIFVRAWCSQMGKSAVVSRTGKCCLSCSIREAFALEVSIIIRVGDVVLRESG